MHTACEPTHPWSFFHPDTIQIQRTIHWFCSVPWVHLYNPLKNRVPLAQPRTEFIKELFCHPCTFHPIVNFQWCTELLENSQPLRGTPLPPTRAQTNLVNPMFFLSWPETQLQAWGKIFREVETWEVWVALKASLVVLGVGGIGWVKKTHAWIFPCHIQT